MKTKNKEKETKLSELLELKEQIAFLTEQLQTFFKKQEFTPSKNILLYDWLTEWKELYKIPNLTAGGLRNINNAIKNHIKPNLENKLLTELNGLDIQKALNEIKFSYTRKFVFNVLNNSFKKALRLKLIKENPMLIVDPIRHTYKKINSLSLDQQNEFLQVIESNQYKNLFLFYLLSGCRRSEALTLEWQDIDYNANSIFIKGTKTETSSRKIPLFSELKELLDKIPKKNEKVFNCSINALKCVVRRLKPKFEWNFHLHKLRHTFATRCLESGISIKILQLWLGHAKVDTTANIYTHIHTDFELEQVKKFNPKICPDIGTKTDPHLNTLLKNLEELL